MSSTATKNEGFASRWSRRKIESETNYSDEANEGINEISDEIMLSEEEISEQKLAKLNALTDADMPDLETLGEDSDYSGFMSSNVSEALRKIALQTLFHGKSYNIRDGLDEYDGDYTSFEKLDPSVITADMRHLMEVEAEKLLAKEEEKQNSESLLADEDEALSQDAQQEQDSVVAEEEIVSAEDDDIEVIEAIDYEDDLG
jgi:hypothetical protein